MSVSTRLKKSVRPIHEGFHKGGRPKAAPFVKAAEGRIPLWIGLTSFFKRVETRMFQRVQTGWSQRAFHELLGEKQLSTSFILGWDGEGRGGDARYNPCREGCQIEFPSLAIGQSGNQIARLAQGSQITLNTEKR